MVNLKRLPGESEYAFIWRMGEAKTSGVLDLTWGEIGTLINKEFREDEEDYRTESAYRKQYSVSKLFFDHVFRKVNEGEDVDAFREQRDELYKLKRQFYDQRREYNKVLTAEARWEHLSRELAAAARDLPPILPSEDKRHRTPSGGTEAVLFLSDWHFGLVADNVWNTFNEEVFNQRISELYSKVTKYLNTQDTQRLHVVILGDMIEGVLRPSSQVEASELGCSQIMRVSEVLANFVVSFSNQVDQIYVYSTWGNHGRTVQKIVDSIHEDNLERIIPWWMKERLSNVPNVEFIESDKEFIKIQVYDKVIAAVHGDLDSKANLSKVSSAVFYRNYGVVPSYVCMGHVHHSSQMDDLGAVTMTVGSLSGTDSYANGRRLYATPNQTMLFFTEDDGLLCRYDIGFSV